MGDLICHWYTRMLGLGVGLELRVPSSAKRDLRRWSHILIAFGGTNAAVLSD